MKPLDGPGESQCSSFAATRMRFHEICPLEQYMSSIFPRREEVVMFEGIPQFAMDIDVIAGLRYGYLGAALGVRHSNPLPMHTGVEHCRLIANGRPSSYLLSLHYDPASFPTAPEHLKELSPQPSKKRRNNSKKNTSPLATCSPVYWMRWPTGKSPKTGSGPSMLSPSP
jgi:hypothetical protein